MKTCTKFYYKLLLTCSIILCSSLGQLSAQWTQSNGPIAAEIKSIVGRNGVLYAGTSNGGVFRSIDSAVSWTAINNGIPIGVSSLDFIDTVLYAGAITGELYKSTNGGNSWTQVGTRKFGGISTVVSLGSRLFLGDYNGVYMSFDNGINWNQANLPGPSAMKTVGNSIFVASWGAGLWRSTDIGSSWTKLTNGLTATFFSDMTIVGSAIFVGSWPGSAADTGALFRSTDNGANWTNITANFPAAMNEIHTLESSSSTLYATGLWMRGIYVSSDFGNTWKYGGLHGGSQSLAFPSMKIIGSRLYVGMADSNRIAYADTSFILNYKPAILTLPLDNTVNISLTPTFRWSKRTFLNNHYIQISTSRTDWSQSIAFDVTTNSYTPSKPLSYKTKYYWRIAEGNTYFGVSDTFSFTTTPKLTVTYPNGGEILAAGDSVTIAWDGTTPQDTVILELNTGGATWDSVNYFARNGQYRWKVPKIESARCRISVVTTLDSDDSDSTFTISIPKGVASDIDFGLTNVGTSVQKVSYCISTGIALLKVQEVLFETGKYFYLKGINRKNDSSFITIVFDPQTAGSFTDKAFIITQAGDTILANLKGDAKDVLKPTIIYPNGGEILSAGDTITIQWKGVALQDSVTLAKTTNGGNTWTFFTTKIADSSYKWEVPKVESSQCKIRILTKSDSDDSDNDFTISIPQGKASTIDFGNVELQKVEFKDITLTNTGLVPLKITMFRNTQGNPYSTADTAKQTIQPGNSSQVMITYIPTILGITTDTMQWITSAGDIITATMRGNGVSPKPGLNVSFTVSSISMCQFTDTLVTVRVSGGTLPIQYTWSNTDGTSIPQTELIKGGTITDSTIRLLPKNTNTYRVIVTDNQGQKDTATITITVKKHPTPKLLLTGSNIICEGDSTRIDVVNADNYSGTPLWSNTATGASILVKKTGVYYCVVDSNGCVGTSDSITITVNPKPNVSISQQGDELVSTTADSYQWLNSAGAIITGATSQRYSPPADGKYSVSVILKGCSATSSQFQFTKSGNSSSIVVLLLDFGKQVVSNIIGRNAPLRNAIRVFNNGNFDRVIDSIQITGTVFNLTRTSFPRPIPSSVTISFNADFTPTTIGKFVETVTVFSQGERFIGVIMGEGIELPADGVITEVELVPQQFEVSPGDTLLVFLRIKDEQPTESKATEFIAAMQYDSRVLQWIPRNRQFNDDNSKRTNYWSLNMQNKKRYKGNNQLDTLKFLVKLSDVDSTALIFTDSTAFIWTDANGKVFPACRDSVVYIKVCKEGGKQFVRFANPDMLKTITPNPSTGNSTITLSMGIEGNCIISLVDIFGQTIQEVQYSKLQAGEHTLRFDDSNLETGTYYVLMKTGYSVSSKKISIVK